MRLIVVFFLILYFLYFPLVSNLKEQLEDMKKISQNSQASNDKITQLQNQVYSRHMHAHSGN